ncbi:MAG: Spy/CpxP family protein refolding chaperone [Candidatus Dadabacteria bacterium]|nr:Spy/CpxP family protein refolding chaperone [Candidatus Dadabacteria bacterium]
MNTLLITSTAVAGVVLISVLGFFGTLKGKDSHKGKTDRVIEWISFELDLTKEQRSKLVLMSDELRNFEREIKNDRENLREEVINMISSGGLDQGRILEWVKEKQKHVDQIAPIIIAELVDFHKSLNPEQRKKIADEVKKHSHQHGTERGFYHKNH